MLLFDCCNECIIDKATTKVSGLLNHIVKILAYVLFEKKKGLTIFGFEKFVEFCEWLKS